MTVVVTGANGFIGAALCHKLAENGYNVIAVVRNDNCNLQDIAGLRIVCCDLVDYGSLAAKIGKLVRIDLFYHLAWSGTSGSSRCDVDTQLMNIKAACEAVKASKLLGCKRFVFAASIMEYEVDAYMQEEKAVSIGSIYSTAKLSADYMARAVADYCGVEYIRAVISNVYGPGEYSARLINTSIRKMLRGEHCSFSDGEQLYDFIYIDDAVEALVAAGQNGISKRIYYIGNKKPRKLKEFLCEMRDAINPAIEIGLGEIPFNGVSLSYKELPLDNLTLDTGFEIQVDFHEGIMRTLSWIEGDVNG